MRHSTNTRAPSRHERTGGSPFFPAAVVQRTVTVNEPGDAYEREADAVADAVMRADHGGASRPTISPVTVQRKCAACEEEEALQRQPLPGEGMSAPRGGEMASSLPASLQASRGGGQPLRDETRGWMESRFGTAFDQVRVHTDTRAVQLSRKLDAQAFTHGADIYFDAGNYNPGSRPGKRLLAHELTHVVQQGAGPRHLQRATTRGAGGCAAPDALDEDPDGPRGAGRLAHNQIQSFLLPRVINEVRIPRGTKRAIDSTGCQAEGAEPGFADLYLRGGSVHEIGEIKPIRHDMSHAVGEADHYVRRAGQSMDRFFGSGAVCPGAPAGDDDRAYAHDVGVSKLQPTFARMTGVLPIDTVIGAFDGDPSRTLKARLHSPGAIGYWCTGGTSDTFTCGVSDEEMQRYIDRVALAPAEAVLDEFLRENVERRLQRLFADRSLGDILAVAERHFGASIRDQLRPYLGPLADQIINRASAQEVGRLIEESIGPEARAIVTTLARRLTSLFVAELRRLLRSALARLVREALLALCVGVPVVTLVELLDRLKQALRDAMQELVPVAITAVAVQLARVLAAEFNAMLAQLVAALSSALGVIGEFLASLGAILLRALAAIAWLLLCLGVLVVAVLALAAIFTPVPGDELALGAGALAMAALVPVLGRFILTGSTEEVPDGA
jgi:hypothetical protein